MNIKSINNKEANCIEVYVENTLVGRVDYTNHSDYLVLDYLYVEEEMRGQGYAKIIATEAYNFAKAEAKPTDVKCSVLRGILLKNEEFSDFNWKN